MPRSAARPSADDLLAWYDARGRDLPWRAKGGRRADPYHVWLSEIMLQQTTVAAVRPYFARFTERWPTVADLAAAPDAEVMAAWAGLGYYARARNLLAAARHVAGALGGEFPRTAAALAELPGIGPYTAAAIAAIAFGEAATVVDGNVERVMARLFAVTTPLPAARPELRRLAAGLTPARRPGDYAQGVMDLGAMLCRPRRPLCQDCPWGAACKARAAGIAGTLPARAQRKARPTRHGVAFWVENAEGGVLLRRRPATGLLGGMMEVPSTLWREEGWSEAEALGEAPVHGDWRAAGAVSHTFTHFHLELEVWAARVGRAPALRPGAAPERCRWVPRADLGAEALPSVMRKVARAAG